MHRPYFVIMKILAIADIHGNRRKLRDILARAQPADVIVLAGDLTHLGSPDEAAEAVELDPFQLPLGANVHEFTTLKGVPGAVRDGAPDARVVC